MIDFRCSGCGETFQVDDSNAGKKAKCPKCSTVLVIPAESNTGLLIYDDGDLFTNKALAGLYKQFIDENNDIVIAQQVVDAERAGVARLEIHTSGFRSQRVFLFMAEIEDEAYVCFYSPIGQIAYSEQAVAALRAMDLTSPYCLSLGDDDVLQVSMIRRLSNLDDREFCSLIVSIAAFADASEQALLGVDIT